MEEQKPVCFGNMDCFTTGDCGKCNLKKKCYELSFNELLNCDDNKCVWDCKGCMEWHKKR